MQIVFNSCKLLVFKRYAMRRLRILYSTVNVSESFNDESSPRQIIPDSASHVSAQSISALGQNSMKANPVQIPF